MVTKTPKQKDSVELLSGQPDRGDPLLYPQLMHELFLWLYNYTWEYEEIDAKKPGLLCLLCRRCQDLGRHWNYIHSRRLTIHHKWGRKQVCYRLSKRRFCVLLAKEVLKRNLYYRRIVSFFVKW